MITFFGNSDRGGTLGSPSVWREFDRLMREFDAGWPVSRRVRAPQTGFTEHEDRYEMLVPAPGMHADDVELQVHGGVLALRASVKPTAPEGYRVTHAERNGYEYSRSFRLPTNADAQHISAKLTDGILTVSVAKVAEAKPKRIAVKAS